MTFINVLVNTLDSLEERCNVRRDLIEDGFLDVLSVCYCHAFSPYPFSTLLLFDLQEVRSFVEGLGDSGLVFKQLRTQLDLFDKMMRDDTIETTRDKLDLTSPDSLFNWVKGQANTISCEEQFIRLLQALAVIPSQKDLSYVLHVCLRLFQFSTFSVLHL